MSTAIDGDAFGRAISACIGTGPRAVAYVRAISRVAGAYRHRW
ncbi:hypothetical protein [Actinoallomurus iriomotensis]|nr:hypothetical protein [Actinoallomurus iriomotensis]